MIDRIETNIENAADWIQEGARVVAKCVNIANQRVIAVVHDVNKIACDLPFYYTAKDMLLLLVAIILVRTQNNCQCSNEFEL
jgi:hypothetical protein